jgi:hypothetical protein
MLSELLDKQVSGNNWKQTPVPMVYQDLQQVAFRDEPRTQRDVIRDLEQQMERFEAEHEAALIELKKQYVFPGDRSVEKFLHEHRTIPQLLILAAPQLRRHFGADTVFSLRAPIEESGTRTLYGVVMWPGQAQEVRNRIERFDDGWWIGNSRQASGNLYFTYELV